MNQRVTKGFEMGNFSFIPSLYIIGVKIKNVYTKEAQIGAFFNMSMFA